jgi:transcriptional regulator with XRE-family HTH domain
MLHCGPKGALYDADMTIGERIKARRKMLKMTQGKLGDLLGVTDKAVSAWERDENPPALDKIAGLRRALKANVIWLLEGIGRPEDEPERQEGFASEGLDDHERVAVQAMIDSFLQRRNKPNKRAS